MRITCERNENWFIQIERKLDTLSQDRENNPYLFTNLIRNEYKKRRRYKNGKTKSYQEWS